MNLKKCVFASVVAVLLIVAGGSPARAQGGPGVEGGLNLNPNQFYFGGHYELGPVTDKVWFRPNVNIGLGNNTTLLALNFELAYWLDYTKLKDWKFYVGGGPAINYYDLNGGGIGVDDSDVGPGLNLLFGISNRKGLFLETKIGVIDSPDFRFGVGYTFKQK